MERHYTKLRFYDVNQDANLGYRCLGKDCPNSCCYSMESVEITISELPELSKHFPIHFPFNQGLNKFVVHAVLRLPEDEGGCIQLEPGVGCKLGEKRPLFCKSYPLFVQPETKNLIIDPVCPGISEGEPRKIVKKGLLDPEIESECVVYAVEYAEGLKRTYQFTDFLNQHGLIAGGYFEAKGIKIPTNSVNELSLMKLPINTLYEAISTGYMKLIYAHLNSLDNFFKLIEKSKKQTKGEELESDIVIL